VGFLCLACAALLAYFNGFLFNLEPIVRPSPFLVRLNWLLTVAGILLFFGGAIYAYFDWISKTTD
jgi:hypothetical protein